MTQNKAKSKTKDKVLPKKHITVSALTPQQEKFARLVSEGYTYVDAYSIAYPKSKKWVDNSRYVESSKMMANPKISQRVKELIAIAAKESEVTLSYVLTKLAQLLDFNIKDVFNEDGTMKGIHELTDEQAFSIQDFQVEEIWGGKGENRTQIGVLKKVKLSDKQSTIDKFLRKMGAYITTLKVENTDLQHIESILDGIKEK